MEKTIVPTEPFYSGDYLCSPRFGLLLPKSGAVVWVLHYYPPVAEELNVPHIQLCVTRASEIEVLGSKLYFSTRIGFYEASHTIAETLELHQDDLNSLTNFEEVIEFVESTFD